MGEGNRQCVLETSNFRVATDQTRRPNPKVYAGLGRWEFHKRLDMNSQLDPDVRQFQIKFQVSTIKSKCNFTHQIPPYRVESRAAGDRSVRWDVAGPAGPSRVGAAWAAAGPAAPPAPSAAAWRACLEHSLVDTRSSTPVSVTTEIFHTVGQTRASMNIFGDHDNPLTETGSAEASSYFQYGTEHFVRALSSQYGVAGCAGCGSKLNSTGDP